MPQPSLSMITATRWRTADALLAIAEDPKASARERRLAAMAVLDLCDKAESNLASPALPLPAEESRGEEVKAQHVQVPQRAAIPASASLSPGSYRERTGVRG